MTEPLVGVIMGSRSDWDTMKHAAETFEELAITFESSVVSAHRTPDLLFGCASTAAANAHLPVLGAINAAPLAAAVVALHDDDVRDRLIAFRQAQTENVLAHPDPTG